jgi:acetyl-CoA carboxylase biotin carboxyl carrier protein
VKKTVQKAAKGAVKNAAKKEAPAKAAPKAAAKAAPNAAESKSAGGRNVEGSLVKQLASILDETALTEIEYEAGGVRVRVARNHAGGGYAAPASFAAPAAPAAALPAPVAAAPAAPAQPADPASHPGTVKSPMVGVCYLLPEPGAAPFAKEGDSVSEGQTLCLIEAMKTFNPVKAPRSGKVVKIIVENGAPVEYGEPLLIIE